MHQVVVDKTGLLTRVISHPVQHEGDMFTPNGSHDVRTSSSYVILITRKPQARWRRFFDLYSPINKASADVGACQLQDRERNRVLESSA